MTKNPCLIWPGFFWGKLYADRGYISNTLTRKLKEKGIDLITRARRNMKPAEHTEFDSALLRKRSLIETVFDQLNNLSQIEHIRHRSSGNFIVNFLAGIVAYCIAPSKPKNEMTYPLEFRQQALAIRKKENLIFKQTAERSGGGIASIMRRDKNLQPVTKRYKAATKINMDALAQDVATYPDACLYERASLMGVSRSGIVHALKRMGVTHKKNAHAPPPSGPAFRQNFTVIKRPVNLSFILMKVVLPATCHAVMAGHRDSGHTGLAGQRPY